MPAISRDQRISELLAREDLFHGAIHTTLLKGGLWNDAVRVEAGKRIFVFKTFCEVDENAFFPNSATDEAEALQRLSGLEVSPEFVAIWPEEKLLAYEYIDGSTWSVDVKCSDGLCGVCRCGLIAGEVEHRDFVLSEKQRETLIILCQSRAVQKDGIVEIDL